MEKEEDIIRDADRVGSEIIESMQHPVKVIYMDSDFLYDYRLGSLLLLLKGEKDYEYVIKKLDEYENNPSMKITRSFPELGLTEQDIDLIEYDVARQIHLHAISPRTGLLDGLTDILASINTYNKSQTDNLGIKLVINCRRHLMPKAIWDMFVEYVSSADKSVDVSLVNYSDWDDIPEETFRQFDMLFIYDMINFGRSGRFRDVAQKLSAANKLVFAFPQLEKDRDNPEEAKDALHNFEIVMGVIFSKFSYIKRTISRKQ